MTKKLKHDILKCYLTTKLTPKQKLVLVGYLQKTGQIPPLTTVGQLLNIDLDQAEEFVQDLTSPAIIEMSEWILADHPFITIADKIYPTQLREIYMPPLLLFYQGDLELLQTPIVSMVGSRHYTSYGQVAVRQLIPPLVAQGITVCSGLAQGIDGLVHRTTIGCHGKTIAVIGTGLDRYYPPANKSLQQLLAKKGLVLSEYLPQASPLRWHFPHRNRIIAGLSQATIVVEAGQKSGSLITANMALRENRDVLAVPGPIDEEKYVGCNQLIQAGAKPVLTATDILDELQL